MQLASLSAKLGNEKEQQKTQSCDSKNCLSDTATGVQTGVWVDVNGWKGTDLEFHWPFVSPSGHYLYRQFNIQQFYVLPTHCIYVFCVDLRANSDYFPIQH